MEAKPTFKMLHTISNQQNFENFWVDLNCNFGNILKSNFFFFRQSHFKNNQRFNEYIIN